MGRDKEVNAFLENAGWVVLRFWSGEVRKELERVVGVIEKAVTEKATLTV